MSAPDPAPTAVAGRPMQAEDSLGLRAAGDAQPSPDGQHIAFVVSELDRAADRVRSSVWLVPAAGGAARRLTSPEHHGSQPRWSPDGQTLAFIASRERGAQIWLLPLGRGEPVRLTDLPGGVTGPPVWSPNGQRIAFTARVRDGETLAPGAPRVIRRLRYLLNGAGYIGDGYWHVFTVPANPAGSAAAQPLTTGEWHHFSPCWSPDGAQIACVTTRRDDWDTEWVWDVYVLDAGAEGVAPRRLTGSRGVCAGPSWSPDGRWIAYYDNQCAGTGSTRDYHLWLFPAAGGEARSVSAVLDRGCPVSEPPSGNEPPQWSADSSTLFFHIREGGFYHYYAYDLSRAEMRTVLTPRDVTGPIAGLVRRSAHGALLAFASATAVCPAEVYACAADGSGFRQLTDLNASALASFQVRAPQRLAHRSPEGWEVETWLWLPPAYRSGDGRLPTVLYFHGGPHNNVSLSFNEQLHVLAGAGFAVVAPNFRGSTGFGAAFADSILGDWGLRELADGLAILDVLQEQGIVDHRRLGVYGGSYGGFMTNLALARSDRFAAGVSFATISGLDSFSYLTDHWESIDWDSGGAPWQIPDYYRTHSPLTDVAQIQVPLLILHGEEDYRCSVAEADQLFGALRKLKRPVELVRYPGGSHAFAHIGPPSHRMDAMQRVTTWFQRYL